jgi:hypothetical protein
LKTTNCGCVIDFNQKDELKRAILDLYSKFIKGNLVVESENIGQFHRKELTKKVSEILKEIIE